MIWLLQTVVAEMTAVVATITVDVDAVMETVFSEIIPVAVFSGSSA